MSPPQSVISFKSR